MGVFEDLGVMVDGLEDDTAEEYEGDAEEIFRFDVFLTEDQEVEIGVQIQELEVTGYPEFGEEYGQLAHLFADLVVEHIGMDTTQFMETVANLQELDVQLTEEEQNVLTNEVKNENGSVLMYSFPVIIMGSGEDLTEKQMGAGFNRSQKADIMLKIYGKEFAEAEEAYQDSLTDQILDHGTLFLKAVEAIQKL